MEDVIRKIRKLLALSGSPNPNEAAAAAAKARKLLLEHNLSMDALGVAPEEVREEVFATGARSVVRGALIFAGAKLHLCALLYGGQAGRNGSWILVGRPGNIEAARVLIQYLLDAMDRCTKIAATGRGLAWANDYRRGWVTEMCSRLEGLRKADETVEERGLVIREDAAVREHLETQKIPQSKPRKLRDNVNANAYTSGRRDAQNVSLSSQIEQELEKLDEEIGT